MFHGHRARWSTFFGRAAAFALASVAFATVAVNAHAHAAARTPASFPILVSSSATRVNAMPLAGARVSPTFYAFIERRDVREVRFWLDRSPKLSPSTIEDVAPYDAAGGTVTHSRPLSLRPGRHTLVARTLMASGRVHHATAVFTVVVTPSQPAPTPAARAPRRPLTPGPSNTGVPAGYRLRPSEALSITVDGTVIDGLDVRGCIDVRASHVIIRRTKITCARPTTAIRTWSDVKHLVVEDTTIDGSGVVSAAVGFSNFTLRRVNIFNCIDGPRLSDNTTVEHSWIHDLKRTPTSHNDTLQTTGGKNIVIRGNTLDVYNRRTDDLMNAGLMIGSTTGPIVENMLIENNLFNGGNYTVNIRADVNASRVVFRNNRFGRDHRYGAVVRQTVKGVTFGTSNVWEASGRPVT